VRILSSGLTDVGRVRSNNEDCFRIIPQLNLFVLSDGMGGEAHGEIASAMAVETVVKHCMDLEINQASATIGAMKPEWSEETKRLSSAIHQANANIHQSAVEHPEQQGMGATLSAAWIHGATLSLSHVGDSRAYLLRSKNLVQLTTDHSLVAEQVRRGILTTAEAEESEMQSVLLRALGAQPEIEVETDEHTLFPKDILLLCSDGLTRMVSDAEIAKVLQSEPNPAKSAGRLIALANNHGGIDNISVVVVCMESNSKGWFSWFNRGAGNTAARNGSGGGK
jgi:serine/threonine protein phosphatase PrpC